MVPADETERFVSREGFSIWEWTIASCLSNISGVFRLDRPTGGAMTVLIKLEGLILSWIFYRCQKYRSNLLLFSLLELIIVSRVGNLRSLKLLEDAIWVIPLWGVCFKSVFISFMFFDWTDMKDEDIPLSVFSFDEGVIELKFSPSVDKADNNHIPKWKSKEHNI